MIYWGPPKAQNTTATFKIEKVVKKVDYDVEIFSNTLNISLHSLFACLVSEEKSDVIVIPVPPWVRCFLPFWLLKILSLSLTFCSLNMTRVAIDLGGGGYLLVWCSLSFLDLWFVTIINFN